MQKSCLGFPVEFVRDVFGDNDVLSKVLKEVTGCASPRILIVADLNVVQRTEGLGAKIGKYVNAHGIELADRPAVLAGGEKLKSEGVNGMMKVVSAMLSAKLGKSDVVLAIGGGTLLDVTSFAAAQVRGGLKIVRVPTTPASVFGAVYAGYGAIDIGSVKDAMRVPSVPVAAVIDVTLSTSVLDGVWRGGIGEAVRTALALDSALMKKIIKYADEYTSRDLGVFEELAQAVYAARSKKAASAFALWSAVRLESMSGYKLPHGYAVPIGVCIDAGYSAEKGYIKEKERDSVYELLLRCGSLDGLRHSQHLLTQIDSLLLGLDSSRLFSGNQEIEVLAGIGKTMTEVEPDREVYRKVIKDLVALTNGK